MKKSNLMTKNQIIDYIFENFDFFNKKENLICEEIGDGNINYVFRVYDKLNNKSVVVKQSDTLLRSSGRPLDIYRSKIEAEVLKIENDLSPGSVPEIYHYDEEKALIVMEDISDYKNLRKEFLEGNIYNHLADSFSEFLADTLIPTTDLVISRAKKKERAKKFTNPELCDITEDLVLTEPYFNYKNRNIITDGLEKFVEDNLYNDKKLHFEVLKLKDKFQNYSQALLHGDLHLGSIFANEKGIKVIDPEFSFYGPIGYDIGNVWGNIVFPLANYLIVKEDKDILEKILNLLKDTIDKTIEKLNIIYNKKVEFEYFNNEDFKKYYIREIISDSIGYAGTEIIRRTVGDSKVIEISSVEDINLRRKLDTLLVEIGKELIINREKISKGQEVINIINEKFEGVN